MNFVLVDIKFQHISKIIFPFKLIKRRTRNIIKFCMRNNFNVMKKENGKKRLYQSFEIIRARWE